MKWNLENEMFDCKNLLKFLKEKNALPAYWSDFETWSEKDWENINTFYTGDMDVDVDLYIDTWPSERATLEYPGCDGGWDCSLESVKLIEFTKAYVKRCSCGCKQHTTISEKDVCYTTCDACGAVIYDKNFSNEQKDEYNHTNYDIIESNVKLEHPLDITEFIIENDKNQETFDVIAEKILEKDLD